MNNFYKAEYLLSSVQPCLRPNKYPQNELQVKCEWGAMISWLLCDLSHRYSLLPAEWKVAVRNIMGMNENYNMITVNDADLAELDVCVLGRFMCIFY